MATVTINTKVLSEWIVGALTVSYVETKHNNCNV